jgi:hypothetical protein
MKKIAVLMLIVASVLFLFAGCSNDAPVVDDGNNDNQSEDVPPEFQNMSLGEQCEKVGGEWLDNYSECVGIEEEFCTEMGGEHNDCASACRHDPTADVCTMQCVIVCSFE